MMAAGTKPVAVTISDPLEAQGRTCALAVMTPALARFAPRLRELASMLPIVDINGTLVTDAPRFAGLAERMPLCAGVLMCDPFLVADEVLVALRSAGVRAVANYPTIQVLDGPSGAGLAAVGINFSAELLRLTWFRQSGMAAHAYVTDAASARQALGAGLTDLVLHPAFRTAAETEAILSEIESLAPGRVLLHQGASP